MCYIRLQSADPERTLNNNTLKQFVHLQKSETATQMQNNDRKSN